MNAMILAAGKGTRMRPLTLTTPKPLLPAGGKPLIGYHLESLRDAGFRQVVINHAWLGEQLEAELGDGSDYDVEIRWSREGEPLETAGGILQALPLLDSDWFLVINGDIWSDFNLSRLIEPPLGNQALLVMVNNPPHNAGGDFHLTPEGQILPEGGRRLTFSGISLLHRSLFDGLEPGHHRLAPLLADAMNRGHVRGVHHQGRWFDIGTRERLAELDRFLKASGAC